MNFFHIPEVAFEEFYNYHCCKVKSLDTINFTLLGKDYYFVNNPNKIMLQIICGGQIINSNNRFIYCQSIPKVKLKYGHTTKSTVVTNDKIDFISHWSKYIQPVGKHIFSVKLNIKNITLNQDGEHVSVISNDKVIATFAYSAYTTEDNQISIHSNDISNTMGTIKKVNVKLGNI